MPSSKNSNAFMSDRDVADHVEKCSAFPMSLNPSYQVSIDLGMNHQYVLMGSIRVELRLRAVSTILFALDAIELVVNDASGAVVFHRRPTQSGVDWECRDFTEDRRRPFFGASKDHDGVVELSIPQECLVANHRYFVHARLVRYVAPAVVAEGSFTTRAPTDLDRDRRRRMGVDPYVPNITSFILDADLRPALGVALAEVHDDDPWRAVILLAHVYAGTDEPSRLPTSAFTRLGDGAFTYSTQQLYEELQSKDPDPSVIGMRKFRLQRGPGPDPSRRVSP